MAKYSREEKRRHHHHPSEPRRTPGWKARVAINLRKVLEYLQHHPCVDCPESDPVVLEFDHVKGRKRASISALVHAGIPWEEIMEEIKITQVRCANCHRRRHARLGQFFIYRQTTTTPEGLAST